MEINPLVPFLRLLTLCSLVCATHVHAQEVWLPLSDLGLTSETSGNALDFSALVPRGPAGRNGWSVVLPDAHIGFDSQRDPQRFLCASMVFSGLNGNIPDKAGSEALVRELRRTGYNLVRLHYIDAQLMAGRLKDFDFDPVQLDRLHYLLAKLKEGGIYWMVDGLTSDNAAYGDVQPHRYTKKYNAKLDVLTTEPGYAHWAALVARLWGMKNPYTGLPPLQDPAMLGLILVNEGSLGYLATIQGGRYPAVLAPLFRDWLKGRYVTDAALKASWAKEAKSDESLSGAVGLPESVRGGSPRDVDFARFVADLERSAYKRMERHVRQLGFRGLVTAFDSWGFFSADISRSAAQSIDMHSYHALPTIHGQPGSKMAQTSVHANTGRYLRELSNARQWGKPFTVSEYGQPFWNRWRHESAAWVPAMAAHQGGLTD